MYDDYDTGYADGQSSAYFDWQFAFSEHCEVPSNLNLEDPVLVAQWVSSLQEHRAALLLGLKE